MKLTIEHLASYLPYGLIMSSGNFRGKLQAVTYDGRFRVSCSNYYEKISDEKYKPLLRPLSDIDTEIQWNFKGQDYGKLVQFSNIGYFRENISKPYSLDNIKNGTFHVIGQIESHKLLYAHHFDVFGLIDSGLAISISNQVKNI